VTKGKLTSSPKAPFTVEGISKTTISKVDVRANPLGVCALFSTPVFSEAYRRRVLRVFLIAECVGKSGPIHMYSATLLCCANHTKVAKGLLLGEWPSTCKGWWAFV
jgi:hypothetical protein